MSFIRSLKALPPMAARLVAMRFFIYLGVQSAYFIGIVGTLTFTMGRGVGDNVLGIGFLNLCMVLGSFMGGPLLDRIGPRQHFRLVVAGLVFSAAAFQVLADTVAGVLAGAMIFGVAWGMGDLVAKAYPAYISDDAQVLKDLNSVVFTVSNIAIVVGPLVGGTLAAALSTRAVFLFMGACSLLALAPGLRFDALRQPSAPAEGGGLSAGFATVFKTPALSLLFWACFFSFFGYGAFDPIESLYYRDVLKVGIEWMGYLSSAAGVGGIVGSLLVLKLSARHVNVRAMMAVLLGEGLGILIYVATDSLAVAMAGQIISGVAFGMMMPLLNTLVQVHAPLDILGRVNSVMSFGYNIAGVMPLLMAPALADALGVQGTLVGASLLVCAMPLAISIVRRKTISRLVAEERAMGLSVEPGED